MRRDILVKLRDYLTNNPEHNLKMQCYVGNGLNDTDCLEYKQKIDCGTNTCVAGLIPLVAPDFANNYIMTDNTYDFCSMSREVVDYNHGRRDWVFGTNWPDDVSLAIKRIDMVLNGEVTPKMIKGYRKILFWA